MVEKKSVKEFQNEIRAEEVKMQEYGKEFNSKVKSLESDCRAKKEEMKKYGQNFNTTVNGLKNNWKAHGKDLKKAAMQMRNQGINKMKEKVKGFNNEILNQKKENRVAVSRMKGDVNLFISEIDGTKKDFQSYARAFWG